MRPGPSILHDYANAQVSGLTAATAPAGIVDRIGVIETSPAAVRTTAAITSRITRILIVATRTPSATAGRDATAASARLINRIAVIQARTPMIGSAAAAIGPVNRIGIRGLRMGFGCTDHGCRTNQGGAADNTSQEGPPVDIHVSIDTVGIGLIGQFIVGHKCLPSSKNNFNATPCDYFASSYALLCPAQDLSCDRCTTDERTNDML
jgi:hypothetical protein